MRSRVDRLAFAGSGTTCKVGPMRKTGKGFAVGGIRAWAVADGVAAGQRRFEARTKTIRPATTRPATRAPRWAGPIPDRRPSRSTTAASTRRDVRKRRGAYSLSPRRAHISPGRTTARQFEPSGGALQLGPPDQLYP